MHFYDSAAGVLLNGRRAEVRGEDERTGRLMLRLEESDPQREWKKVKPCNVQRATVERRSFMSAEGSGPMTMPSVQQSVH